MYYFARCLEKHKSSIKVISFYFLFIYLKHILANGFRDGVLNDKLHQETNSKNKHQKQLFVLGPAKQNI